MLAEYVLIAGIPRSVPSLDTMTIRPRRAERIAGSSRRVRRTGPKRLVREHVFDDVDRHLLHGTDAGDAGVVDDPIRRPDAIEDHRGGLIDRRRVIEVEAHSDQTLFVERCPEPFGEPLHPDIGCAHRRHDRPAAVEMRGGRQTEAA